MKINIRLPAIILALTCISFITALNASTICRNALFLAFVFSAYGIYKDRANLSKNFSLYVLFATSIYSLSTIFHGQLFQSKINYIVDENYYYSSLRLLMGVVVFYYLSQKKKSFNYRELLFSGALILVGFTVVSFQGVYLHNQNPVNRLEIKTVATTVAYVYAIQAFAAIYVLSLFKGRFAAIAIILAILLSFYVLLLTETRSVILTYPVIVFIFFMQKKLINIKVISGMLAILTLIIIFNHQPFYNAFSRVTSTLNEVNDYNNNNGNTSLGSRFSLWKAGLNAFELHPLGQSADQRFIEVKNYIDTHEYQNPEALRAMSSHMHNDVIDTLSLRGLWGVVLLIFLLFSFAYVSLKKYHDFSCATLLILPHVIYGLTDTLFIDLRCVTVLILGFSIYLLIKRPH
ncbi:O-antigen ligase family protein [Candidatus Pantoea formicae]|uniref:O-antigen ligase family protein n=1 Tax=Candidatus Pantoea formicae TaxID=2608355 RepID=UPI003EDB1C52